MYKYLREIRITEHFFALFLQLLILKEDYRDMIVCVAEILLYIIIVT